MAVDLKFSDRQRHDLIDKLNGAKFDLSLANETVAGRN